MANSSLVSTKVAELYGISDAALCHYEAEGIVSPLRVGDERYYSAGDRLRVEIILKGRSLGFSLAEIKILINTHLPEPREVRGSAEIIKRIAQLEDEKSDIQAAIDRLAAQIRSSS